MNDIELSRNVWAMLDKIVPKYLQSDGIINLKHGIMSNDDKIDLRYYNREELFDTRKLAEREHLRTVLTYSDIFTMVPKDSDFCVECLRWVDYVKSYAWVAYGSIVDQDVIIKGVLAYNDSQDLIRRVRPNKFDDCLLQFFVDICHLSITYPHIYKVYLEAGSPNSSRPVSWHYSMKPY